MMTIAKDWIGDAARAICSMLVHDHLRNGEDTVRLIITNRCPLKPDVAYMPVPRCDSCKHWTPPRRPEIMGQCGSALVKNLVTNDEWGEFDTAPDFGCVQWEAK